MPAVDNTDTIRKWTRIAIINLLIVALLGVTMRYKIAYSLPFIEQENFLHAHYHFAFTGWVTQALMTLMVAYLAYESPGNIHKKYTRLLLANLLVAYAMLLSFAWGGFSIVSISSSTFAIIVSYVFAIIYWKDLNRIKTKSVYSYWFKAALVFNVISSFGAFFLSYMMANRISHPNWYLASTYYFLHFQYNGWFFFACMGLLSKRLTVTGISEGFQKKVFIWFAAACGPAYFLSALWLHIPVWVYIIVVFAALAQLFAWIILLKKIIVNKTAFFQGMTMQTKWVLILSGIALSIKLLLQAGSTIPYLSKLAFGFRPVVIGYLHLVLLGVISLFIIGYAKMNNFISNNRTGNRGIVVFISGIILNELFLMIQGISYMNYISVPLVNELLLGAAVCMFAGVFFLTLGNKHS